MTSTPPPPAVDRNERTAYPLALAVIAAAVAGVAAAPVFDPTKRDYLGRIDTKATYANLVANLPSWVDLARARA